MPKSDDIKIDSEFKGLIPPLSDDEFRLLDDSVRAEGVRDPLGVWDSDECRVPVLLDGHNRYEICRKRGLSFEIVAIGGIDVRDDAIEWIIKNQLGRRNLDPMTRVQLARRLEPMLRKKAEAHQQTGLKQNATVRTNSDERGKVDTMAEVAKVAGVSRNTAYVVARVERDGVPALVEAVKDRKVSLDAADRVARLPKKAQIEIMSKGPAAVKRKAREMRASGTKGKPEAAPAQTVNALSLLKMIIPDLLRGDCVRAIEKIRALAPWLVSEAKMQGTEATP